MENQNEFTIPIGITFDDVLLVPQLSELMPDSTISTRTLLCKDLYINTPFISAAMDTVTGPAMAIKMALNGGIGIIHRNCSIEDQVNYVAHVKRHTGNMVKNPLCLSSELSLQSALDVQKEHGFTTIPITEEGVLRGLITERHFTDYKPNEKLSDIMVPFNELIIASEGTTLEQAGEIMKSKAKKRLLIVESEERPRLLGIYFKKDMQNKGKYPTMAIDKNGGLLVGGAIGVGDEGWARAVSLINTGVDVLCIDTAQGHSLGVSDMVKRIKQAYPHVPIIAGNVVTAKGAQYLIDAGADAIKVGVGPGAICTTREVTGHGVPQISAILEVSSIAKKYGIPVVADGGIKTSGDVVKAIIAGANTIMTGSVLAGTDEAPGERIEEKNGGKFKIYRGMGSLEALKSGLSNDRYSATSSKKIPEGVSGKVPYKGSVQDIIDTYLNALVQSMRVYQGASSISELQKDAHLKLIRQTSFGKVESGTRVVL